MCEIRCICSCRSRSYASPLLPRANRLIVYGREDGRNDDEMALGSLRGFVLGTRDVLWMARQRALKKN